MRHRKTILITSAGGSAPVYLARKLRAKYRMVLADASRENVAPHLGFPFAKIPFGNSPAFTKAIDRLVKKWKPDCIVPGADEELMAIKNYCDRHHITCITPSSEFIKLCLDKKRLIHRLAELGISKIPVFEKANQVKFPAVAKPRVGRGSRQMHVIRSGRELEGYFKLYNKNFANTVVQPYIAGDEYTVSVIVNNLNKVIGVVPKKIIVKQGITRAAMTRSNPTIVKAARQIVQQLKPCGPFNIQLKLYRGLPYIFEINPRLSTTAVLTEQAFGNEVELYLKYYDREKIINPPRLRKNIFLYRVEENIFK